ncbi:23S rRNA m(6)A-1618 methyltransferase [Tenacibaculum sp. MAR_2009_124]|uniref:23S rRNA (adenine(1618)-N(6))-methyltransferase RlmF n=1 Tax=Tenacibaculum sp. MAR_2009_124 TaxID=1250059 RepID=UPI00089CB26C|nr:23S rRNA (adenine(1618)-N(6))-methyltransferase RlmF [Tenacibaculum sp. MAR_2009_124]SEB36679.1 23S rRNA m(6)A-1618 methyltransferase [Tenacibaculum sp. MAR_2009_124]
MKSLHPNNIHNNGYDFKILLKENPILESFVVEKFGKLTIDFSDPNAVKTLNRSLLKTHYDIGYWDFPDENLCPPIPGRVDYIHHLADLIEGSSTVKVLDIGTGASCIYPLLGSAIYDWSFVASDVNKNSLEVAKMNIDKNQLEEKIELRYQNNSANILEGIIKVEDKFTLTMCNPPFYASESEARGANKRKSRNLGSTVVRNFSGTDNELWYKGGEKAFLHNYLYQSSQYPNASLWFTSLVSKKENVKSLEDSGKKIGVTKFKKIQMNQGNKVTRIVCWKF